MSQSDTRSVRQIEDDIEASRDKLASTIDQLVYRTKPATIMERQKQSAMVAARDFAYTPDGALRMERVAAIGVAVVALVAISIYRRTR